METVEQRVKFLIANQAGVDVEKLHGDTTFQIDLGYDSLDQVELVMDLEEEFDINIPDDVGEDIRTVGQAIKSIQRIIDGEDD